MSAYPFGRPQPDPHPPGRKPIPPHRDPSRVKLSQLRAAMNLVAAIFKPARAGG